DILLEGLRKLEYRGYDSAGIAVPQDGELKVVRRAGKIEKLASALESSTLSATCGIGHTRWATHGEPNETNAHPQVDCSGKIAVVHNGIIENFVQLRDQLKSEGHVFKSETDTEVVAHLLEKYYAGDLLEAMRKTTKRLQGAYGLAAIHVEHPEEIVVTRKDSPIVVGAATGDEPSALVASDVIALLDFTRDVVFLEDGQFAVLKAGSVDFFDGDGKKIEPEVTHVDWDAQSAERGGFPDFMLKEIFEQPRAVRDTISGAVKHGRVLLDELNLTDDDIDAIDNVYIIGCGTSYHAGLVARELIERWARIPTTVEVASEFRYRNPIVSSSTLVIAVSQSGETADTLAAVRLARSMGARVFAVTNCVGSRITRESDGTLYVKANMEISVAATKSFLAQIACLALIAMFLGQKRGRLTTRQVNSLYYELRETPSQIEDILQDTDVIQQAAKMIAKAHSVMYVGRGIGSTICNEGALKLKEISYLHAEAYPAGELKHGPIALLDETVPVVAVITDSPTRAQTLSNVREVLARGSHVVAVATEGDKEVAEIADYVFYIPPVRDWCSAITASVPLQLLARYVALERGCDVDHPRNLAKSVTVE
ncbi:MAG: glutamine--fructose-6-phosphate transaminase (isomerizing), partial [Coriobacteriales bacterium]